MKDTKKASQRECKQAWNRPLLARFRTSSHMGFADHSPSPRRGSDQPRSTSSSAPRSWEDSQTLSPSESVCSQATEGGENHEREHNLGSPRPRWNHQYHSSASPIPGSSVLHPRTQSTHSKWFRQMPSAYSQPILTSF